MLCSLLKVLFALHCKLALYYVIMSNRVGLRLSTQSRLVCLSACAVTHVEGCGQLRTFHMPISKPHVLGNPPVWLHNGTYCKL
jgi:hypothetical protein